MKIIERHSLYLEAASSLYLPKYSEILNVYKDGVPYMEILADLNEPRVPVTICPYSVGTPIPDDIGVYIGSCDTGRGKKVHFFRSRWPE